MSADAINNFFSFLYTGTLGEITFWLRFLAGIISSALAAACAVAIYMTLDLFKVKKSSTALPEENIADVKPGNDTWQKVLDRLKSDNPADWNVAVITADTIIDQLLKEMGLTGKTMGDRLKSLDTSQLKSLNDVWEAHRIRNRIAHETDPSITREEATFAIENFEKALRELAYIQ